MVKILIAGPRDFTDAVQRQSKNYPDVKLMFVATEPSVAVDVLENHGTKLDAALFGFDDTEIKIMADVVSRCGLNVAVFVSADDLARAYRKWQPYRMKIAPAGKELEMVYRYFAERPELLKVRAAPVEDVPAEPSDRAGIEKRIEVVRQREDASRVVPVDKKTVVVFGQKGGIGKTTIVVSLAESLATLTNMRVLVLDLDVNRDYGDVIRYFGLVTRDAKQDAIEMGDVPDEYRYLALPGERTLAGWVKFPFEMKHDRRLVEFCLIPISKNLYILPPLRTILEAAKIEEANEPGRPFVQKVLDAVRRHFAIVLVDAGNTLSTQVLGAMQACDELIIVSSGDIAVLDSLADFIVSTLNQVNGEFVPAFVLNDIPEKYFGDVEDWLGQIASAIPLVAKLPRDDKVKESIAREARVPYLGAHDIPFTQEMRKVLYHILPKEVFGQVQPEKKKGFLRRFLAVGG